MRSIRRKFLAVAVCVGVVLTLAAPAATAHGRPSPSRAEVVLGGLSSPKGLSTFLGQPVVAQGAFGAPGPVLWQTSSLFGKGRTIEATGPLSLVDIAVGWDGSAWLLGSDQILYRKTVFGDPKPVLNLPEYQANDPDPYDLEDIPTESNPYGLAVLPNGDALVADAANNDIVRVTKHGSASTFARFAPEFVETDHIPGFPEPVIPSEAVPTSITVGRDGVYVGELQGFPFRPGASQIYKLPMNANGALCDADGPSTNCSVWGTGYTSIQDIHLDAWTGKMYVFELAAEGALAFEEGFETGVFPPAVLLEVKGPYTRQLAEGQLSQPGGITTGLFGTLYVTDGLFSEGRLLRIKT